MSMVSIILSSLSCLLCCGGFAFFLILVIGFMVMRKRGKKGSAKEMMSVGVEEVSRAFVKTKKSREEMMREEEEEENRNKR